MQFEDSNPRQQESGTKAWPKIDFSGKDNLISSNFLTQPSFCFCFNRFEKAAKVNNFNAFAGIVIQTKAHKNIFQPLWVRENSFKILVTIHPWKQTFKKLCVVFS